MEDRDTDLLMVFVVFMFYKKYTRTLKLTNKFNKTSTLVIFSNTATLTKSY